MIVHLEHPRKYYFLSLPIESVINFISVTKYQGKSWKRANEPLSHVHRNRCNLCQGDHSQDCQICFKLQCCLCLLDFSKRMISTNLEWMIEKTNRMVSYFGIAYWNMMPFGSYYFGTLLDLSLLIIFNKSQNVDSFAREQELLSLNLGWFYFGQTGTQRTFILWIFPCIMLIVNYEEKTKMSESCCDVNLQIFKILVWISFDQL